MIGAAFAVAGRLAGPWGGGGATAQRELLREGDHDRAISLRFVDQNVRSILRRPIAPEESPIGA
jgi:hypothetical protein